MHCLVDGRPQTSSWASDRERELRREAESWGAPEDISQVPVSDQVPVVDLGAFLRGEPDSTATVVEHLRFACEYIGFYHLSGCETLVGRDLLDETFRAALLYFGRPEALKLREELDDLRADVQPKGTGYLPVGAKKAPERAKGNLVESFLLSNHAEALWLTKQQKLSSSVASEGVDVKVSPPPPLPWPQDLGEWWQQTVLQYVSSLRSLAGCLVPLLAMALGMPSDYFSKAMEAPGPLWRLRMSRYPAVTPEKGQYGLAPHVDSSLLTILASREASSEDSGLAFHSEYLGGWVRPPLRTGMLLVNSGEWLRGLTNDTWPSARHYVTNPSHCNERWSLACFISPSPGALMGVAASCVSPERPAKYRLTCVAESLGRSRGGRALLAPAD
mmetsp:Transcript_8467/g.15975  ORF Transcript_8467/g.15975 Transcript_8467/m.15975 type:complete len:387 (+) Transcript_8467:30-1190(+)